MKKDMGEKHITLEDTETRANLRSLRIAGLLAALGGLLVLAIPPAVKGHDIGPGTSLKIRVENYSRATPETLVRAEREANKILQQAGLQTEWINCAMEDLVEKRGERCRESKGRTGVELEIVVQNEQDRSWGNEFGYAVVPSFARVYYDRITRVATSDNAVFESPILLGSVMAHEIGHLLLGANSHSQSGIMLARWERQQIREAMTGRLLFTAGEAHRIQREVAMRTSSISKTDQMVNNRDAR